MTDREAELGVQGMEKAAKDPTNAAQDRMIRWLVVGVAIVTVATLVVGVWSLPILTSGSDAANATKDSGDVASCRASYNVLVTEATASLDDAARDVDLLTNEVLQAVLQKDQDTVTADLPRLVTARQLVAQQATLRDQAVATYRDAVKRSADDAALFLRDCKLHPPI